MHMINEDKQITAKNLKLWKKVNVQPCFVLDSFGKRFITTDEFLY